jgi:hypothetical protein
VAEPGGGGWWDTHDGAWRRARWLFVLAALIVTLYLAGIVAILVLVGAAIATGDGDVVVDWINRVGVVGGVALGLALFAVATAGIAALGWRGIPRRTLRLSGARAPREHEVDRVRSTATTFGLSYGMQPPAIWVVDDEALNALVFGRRQAGHIGVTTGALELPPPALDALVMFQVSALASRAVAYATSAVDLVLLGEWLTRILWVSGGFAILSTILRVPVDIAAVYVVTLAVVVLVTRPVILFADHDLVALLDDLDELVDLETIRHSNDPAAFAGMLSRLAGDDRRVHSRWQIAHLWFERDLVATNDAGAPDFVERCERQTRRDLVERARVATALAAGQDELS